MDNLRLKNIIEQSKFQTLDLKNLNIKGLEQNTWPVLLATSFFVWVFSTAIYRLYIHPLSKFPGPKIAALTLWYETYYDVWQKGKFVYEIERMHQKYGPIVRINPYEVHIDDPDFYHEFYASSRKLKKYPWYYKVSGVSEVSFGTEDHEVHRQRQGMYKNLFALRSIHAFEPTIKENIAKLEEKFVDHKKSKEPINLSHEYRVLTADTITTYIGLGPSPLLDDGNLGKSYRKYARIVTETSVLVRHFPLIALFRLLPPWMVTTISSEFSILKNHLDTLRIQVELAYNGKVKRQNNPASTMIDGIVGNERHSGISLNEITEEALILEGAGTDSTGQALECATFYILNNPDVTRRLKTELAEAIPNPEEIPPLPKLKELKFFTAVINESLRVCSPASSRFPRVNENYPTEYKGWVIPASTPMSMNIWNNHYNKKIFPNPAEFNPDRWLQPSSYELEKYFVPFGSGSRMCIGMKYANLPFNVFFADSR
ncbi:cytochrome P450 [Geopyxis carbonaria]|nr:cytochrome P450 [Geopyxis carbonaria]